MLPGAINEYVFYPLLQRLSRRQILSKLGALKQDARQSLSERLFERQQRLVQVLAMAGEHVPYYRDLFACTGFSPDLVAKDLRYLEELPYLTKDIIREQGTRMLNENYPIAGLHVRKTGGSIGASILIYYSQTALDWTAAANLFVLEYAGKKRHMREVHLSSRFLGMFPFAARAKEFMKCQAMNRINIQTCSFDKPELLSVWSRIKRCKPYLVQGHPSTLFALAVTLREHGVHAIGIIQVVESTGEQLDQRTRETIEQVFGCRVYDRYGNAEFGVVSHETDAEPCMTKVVDYMVWPETYLFDEGDNEIVLTGLTNDAMPLIRYRTGDLGKIEKRETGFYIKDLQGRVHDIVHIGDKSYPTHYIQDLLDRIGGIEEFQLEEQNEGRLLLRLIVTEADRQGEIAERVKEWWGQKVEVQFTDFDGLKKMGWRNKFRHVVSGVKTE